jgi:uncharacterized protein (TIGR02453 family)
MSATPNHFRPALFAFLRDLERNNDRDWFEANRSRYEKHLLHPAQQFITDFAPRLRHISRHFNADPRPGKGTLFRIYRDVRFAKDKSPYKTWIGIQFRHKEARDAHAPGFYLHLQPGQIMAGAGMWHPDTSTTNRIRDAIVEDSVGWKRTTRGKRFRDRFELGGDSLKRPPRGYDPEHPLIDDLKRKDFFGLSMLTQKAATSADFLDRYEQLCRAGGPLIRFLCKAVGVEY